MFFAETASLFRTTSSILWIWSLVWQNCMSHSDCRLLFVALYGMALACL